MSSVPEFSRVPEITSVPAAGSLKLNPTTAPMEFSLEASTLPTIIKKTSIVYKILLSYVALFSGYKFSWIAKLW